MADKHTKARNMRLLHDTLIYTLNEKERREFTGILSNFQTRRNRENFVVSLRRLLDTPKKQEVVPYLIGILPIRERDHFLNLWMRTSAYNSFYSLDGNRNSRTSRLSGRSAINNVYHNSHLINQRYQGHSERKIPLKQLSRSHSKAKKTSPASRPSSNLLKNRLSASLPSLRSAGQLGKQAKTHHVTLKRDSKSSGFGFSIRGGAEHGLGIFVSSVDEGSVADRKNLLVGDQIVKLNEYDFHNINSATAIKIIQQKKKLRMLVFSSALVPGSRVAHVEYQWVDTNGRPSSPPVNFRKIDDGIGRSRSIGDIRLLQDDDERRVVVHVPSNARLGLRVRGGTEYGIGIFVSSVDQNQVAERSGIRAGDQIVDVNGVDFQEISHKDAVRILKGYKMMSMLLRHIGKIPYARTTFEKTEWLDSARTSRSSSVVSIAQDGRPSTSPEKSKFRQGIAGSQLLHQSTIVVPAHRRIEEQARSVLNDKELAALKYYISQYIQGEIHVEGLVISLFHLFNSSTKISLLNDIRSVIFPQEVDLFDRMVLEKEIEAMKNLNRIPSSDTLSANGSHSKAASDSRSPRVPAKALSYKQLKSPKQQVTSKIPWSPPSTPLPSIPVIEQVVAKEDLQVHKEAPVIDDLDFEEDEEDSYSNENDENIKRNLIEEFDQVISQNINGLEVPSTIEHGNFYEEIEMQKRSAVDNKVQIADQPSPPNRRYTAGENHANVGSHEQAVDGAVSFDSRPVDSVNHTGSRGKDHDSDDMEEGWDADEEEWDAVVRRIEAKKDSKSTSDQAIDDIMALYAKPDKSGIHNAKIVKSNNIGSNYVGSNDTRSYNVGSNSVDSVNVEANSMRPKNFGSISDEPNFDIFHPKLIPGEKLMEIPEIEVSPFLNKHTASATGNGVDETQDGEEDVTIAKDAEILFSAPPVNWQGYKEKVVSTERAESENKSMVNDSKEITSLSHSVKDIKIGKADAEQDDCRNGDGAMTLEELENIGADLEFEFEEEQEIAEFEEIDNDSLSLKFAPIHEQETAPSTPIVNQLNRDSIKSDQDTDKTSRGYKAHSVNIYEKDIGMPLSFAFSGLSGNNRRQRFDVQDISTADFGRSDSFHSFSPRILSNLDINKGSYLTNTSVQSKNNENQDIGPSGAHTETHGSNQEQDVKSVSDPIFESSLTDEVITFPDRNLTNKRIPIISYKMTNSPEKKYPEDNDIFEANSLEPSYSQNHEEKSEIFAFRKLRNIFENEQPDTPRTEYLSEIIRKNNSENRRRFKSSDSLDENSNEIIVDNSAVFGRQMSTQSSEQDSFLNSSNSRVKSNYGSYNGEQDHLHSTTESDLSLFDDFDFSSSISKSKMATSLGSHVFGDKVENSSGYGSEDYSPVNENFQKTVRVGKNREELGIVLEPSKKQQKGVQIKEILKGELYAACQYPQLEVGQQLISVDGESLQGLGVKIATISMNRAFNNPSGRFLEIIVMNLKSTEKR